MVRSWCWMVCTVLCLCAAGCASQGVVHVQTLPPGGQAMILETGAVLADGQSAQLPPGNYTLRDSGHEKGQSVAVALKKGAEHTVVVPLYVPKPESVSKLTLRSEPVGAVLELVELGRKVKDGDAVSVGAGTYTIRAEKKGYAPQPVRVTMDGVRDETVVVQLGTGKGRVQIFGTTGAQLFLNGKRAGRIPFQAELAAGDYDVLARGKGFADQERRLVVVPGEETSLVMDLAAVRASGPVTVRADVAGARVFLDGKELGSGQVRVADRAFGRVEGEAVLRIAEHIRRYGKKAVTHQMATGTELRIATAVERLRDGKWMAEKDALAVEQQRYSRLRVAHPIAVRCTLTPAAADALRTDAGLMKKLHAISRIGDRIVLVAGGTEWVFWKRAASPEAEYAATATAFARKQPWPLPWKKDKAKTVSLATGDLAEMAFALHGARGGSPLLAGTAGKLGRKVTVHYGGGDTGVTVLVRSAGSVSTRGVRLQQFGSLWLGTADGHGEIGLSLPDAGSRVLVVADGSSLLTQPRILDELLLDEKILVSFGKAQVTHLTRLTFDPYEKTWTRDEIEAVDPMGQVLDLSVDALGAHRQPGQYKRSWIVQYATSKGVSQRQFDAVYSVGEVLKKARSDTFFRR